MMNESLLLPDFRRAICNEIDIEQEGRDRYIVYTPFMFDDGDHFVVLLKKSDGAWYFTDEGHTFMHMGYSGVDFTSSSRWRVIESALQNHRIEHSDGELRMRLVDDHAGDCLFSYIQGLSRITNVTQITREFVAATFMDDLRELLGTLIPENRRTFNWFDPVRDAEGNYTIDCMVPNEDRPWFIFGIGNDDKCQYATVCCLHFETLGVPFQSVAIFRDQPSISRKNVARLTDVVGKQFSSLHDTDRIRDYFGHVVLSKTSRT